MSTYATEKNRRNVNSGYIQNPTNFQYSRLPYSKSLVDQGQ